MDSLTKMLQIFYIQACQSSVENFFYLKWSLALLFFYLVNDEIGFSKNQRPQDFFKCVLSL